MPHVREVGLDQSIHSGEEDSLGSGMTTTLASLRLNPSAAGFAPFQDTDFGYQTSVPYGSISTECLTPSRMDHLKTDLALNHTLQATKDMIVQRNHARLELEMAELKKTVTRDLKTLGSKIIEVQKLVPRSHEKKVQAALNDPEMGDFIYSYLQGHPVTADVYLAAAEKADAVATELRTKAVRATGDTSILHRLLRREDSEEAEAYIVQAENADALATEFRLMADRERPALKQPAKDTAAQTADELIHQAPQKAPYTTRTASPCPSEHSVNTSSAASSYEHVTGVNPSSTADGNLATASSWKPMYIASLAPASSDVLSKIPSSSETFTLDFITRMLSNDSAVKWSPGFYYIPKPANTVLSGRSFWLLETDHEPFLPSEPGEHGAKLTAFFNEGEGQDAHNTPDDSAYTNVPVFLGSNGVYRYFGTYSQLRYSDKVDYDTLKERVPASVKSYWADQLSAVGRPDWITTALMTHFWPPPTYTGPLPTPDTATIATPATAKKSKHNDEDARERRLARALKNHALDLVDWRKEAALKVAFLNAEALLQSFENEDSAAEPGLRLWWEYLTCVGFDTGLYEFLVLAKRDGGGAGGNGGEMEGRVGSGGKMEGVVQAANGTTAAGGKNGAGAGAGTGVQPGNGTTAGRGKPGAAPAAATPGPPHLRGRK